MYGYIKLSIYNIYFSISIFPSIQLFIYLSISLSIYFLPTNLRFKTPLGLSTYLSNYVSI